MHGFPQDLDLKPIIGRDLNLLGLGRYDVQLNFDGSGIKICIQGLVKIIDNEKIIASWNEKDMWDSLNFQRLLNQTVKSYSIPNKSILEIIFTNGLALRIFDESEQYESAQIYFNDESIPPVIV